MESRNYQVSRDSIFVGAVVRTDNIYRHEGDSDFFGTKPGQLGVGSWVSYRSMLFVPNDDKLANDLLYKSPNYPILNVTDDNICLKLGEGIVIKDACNLAPLLEYFGYNKELIFEDIMRIRKTFFTGHFAQDNCELFGWKKSVSGFSGISNSVLPREYFRVLDARGNNPLLEALLLQEKINAFAPNKQEGPIRKLAKDLKQEIIY